MSVLIRNARAVTLADGPIPRRGADLGRLTVRPAADVLMQGGVIVSVESGGEMTIPPRARVVEADGRVLLPGFVDCHTHACWAGDRLDEWEMRLRGAAYLDILKAGGGIMRTVDAVRTAQADQLAADLRARLGLMLRAGTTTVEVKSGYGLTTDAELKMLGAVRAVAGAFRGTVMPTALLGHAVDPAIRRFTHHVIEHTLPAVHAQFPQIAVDAFCEDGAWSKDDCARLLDAAMASGHPVRVHADQFHALGMTEWMIDRRRASALPMSVDHLEATPGDALRALASSPLFGVMLPVTGFHTDGRYADGRGFVDAGGALAIASNCNPGSSPAFSMPLVIALAVRNLRLSPAEAIAACTVNAAALLNLHDRGVIARGKRADLVLLRHTDERMLACELGDNPVDAVFCAGSLVAGDV